MGDKDLLPFGAAIASDVLSAFNLPGGNTLSHVANAYVAKKRKEATEIIIKEIASGKHGQISFEERDAEPLIDMAMRYSKAVSEGAARENLILLAQIIAGLKKHRAFEPDLFRRWCRIVEHLSRDQLITIGFAIRADKEITENKIDNYGKSLRSALNNAGYDESETEALITSVSSTGLMTAASAFGGLAYQPTRWLSELAKLSDFELAAAKSE